MLQTISQSVFNQLYLEYRYAPQYQFMVEDCHGEIQVGFDLVKLLDEHHLSLCIVDLKLRFLNFNYGNLSGIKFSNCDLSYSRFDCVNLHDVIFMDCILTHTKIPQSCLQASHERKEEMALVNLDFMDYLA